MDSLIEQFLIKNNYSSFNKKDISLQLMTHPNYPTFLEITDTLTYFGIDNLAAKVSAESLSELPAHFLSSIIQNGSPELVLVSKNDNSIQTRDSKDVRKKWSLGEFLNLQNPLFVKSHYSLLLAVILN